MTCMRADCLPDSCAVSGQGGQALLESLIAVLALAGLWGGLHWLAHYQDAALSATHASRHAAFIATRLPPEGVSSEVTHSFFSGPAYRWKDHRGHAVLAAETSVQLSMQRLPPLSEQAQPGRWSGQAAILRRDWVLEDKGVLRAQVEVKDAREVVMQVESKPGLLKLGVFDTPYPLLARSTGILTGAGHASSDAESQSKASDSGLAWSAAYSASRSGGAEVEGRAVGVDAGWGRPGVSFDWWQPWAGRVPGHLLVDDGSVAEGRD